MPICPVRTKWLAGAAILSLSFAVQADNVLYRYRNGQGVLVIDFSIPPEFAAKGYEVLSTDGRLVTTVPPSGPPLTQEQLLARQEQKKEDAYILRSYTTLKEVESARARKIQMAEKEITILDTNLDDIIRRRAEMRQKAADYQATGRETPESIAKVLVELDLVEENTIRMLAERKRELDEVNKLFDRYAKRLVELRPMAAKDSADSSETTPTSSEPSVTP